MYKIDNATNRIILTRGDSLSLDINISDAEGSPFELAPEDKVTFTVKKYLSDDSYVIQKQGTHITLDPYDTQRLDYGKYYYDVQVNLHTGERYTIISPIYTLGQYQPNFILAIEVNTNG